MRSVFARIGAWCVERPAPVIALAVLLAILGAVGAVHPEAERRGRHHRRQGLRHVQGDRRRSRTKFGDDPVFILIKGDLEQLVLTEDLQRILFLESCLAGTAPQGEVAKGVQTPAICNEIAQDKPAKVVYGPATFLNQFADQATQQLDSQKSAAQKQATAAAAAAYKAAIKEGLGRDEATVAGQEAADAVQKQFLQQLFLLGTKYGISSPPSIRDPTFVRPVVFDSRFTDATPKAKFSFLFPSPGSALITVRFRPDLTEEERGTAIDQIREAVGEDVFQIRNALVPGQRPAGSGRRPDR